MHGFARFCVLRDRDIYAIIIIEELVWRDRFFFYAGAVMPGFFDWGDDVHYYGTRLSENISRREPEGYLLCLNVPVARTGTQDYLPEELGLSPGASLVSVYRPEEEVFSPETIASFEGMPVTNDHPPEGVDVSNIRALQKGHAHNVRRGSGEESDLLLADLIITDPGLISLIMEEGKREISCGYTYELREENGQYVQRKIRGNHVAVVDAGRAGPRVSIKDSKVNEPERSSTVMKKSLSKILARMAKDGDIETVAEIIEEMMEPEAPAEEAAQEVAEAVEEVVEAPAAVVETPEGTTVVVDEATLDEVISRLDQIISLLTPAPAADDDPVEEIAEAVEEAIEAAAETEAVAELPEAAEAVAEIVEEILDPVPGEEISEVLVPDEECEEEPEVISSGDALRAALNAVRPALAKMPKKQRQRVCADIAARLQKQTGRKARDTGVYAALSRASRKPGANPADLGKRIMATRSANRPKA